MLPLVVLDSVFDLVTSECDKDERKRDARRSRRTRNAQQSPLSTTPKEDELLMGYLRKQGGAFGRSWHRRFVWLTVDNLSWASDADATATKIIPLSDVTSVETRVHPRKGEYIHIEAKTRTLDLLAEVLHWRGRRHSKER